MMNLFLFNSKRGNEIGGVFDMTEHGTFVLYDYERMERTSSIDV